LARGHLTFGVDVAELDTQRRSQTSTQMCLVLDTSCFRLPIQATRVEGAPLAIRHCA